MDLFGLKAKRAARKAEEERVRLEKFQAEKKAYQERKAKIQEYLKKYDELENKKMFENFESAMKLYNMETSSCPRCSSKDVIQHFVRTKGELHGEGDSHGSISGNFLSFSCSHSGHSKIDGELDTHPVNKCKNCGHEWHVEKPKMESHDNIFYSTYSPTPTYLYHKIDDYLELKYDPTDLTDECNSLEEKKEKFFKDTSSVWVLNPLKNVPRYMVEYALYNAITSWIIPDYDMVYKQYGNLKDRDCYSYTMPDETWEIVKKIIGWRGENGE